MVYGITGNTKKDALWAAVAALVKRFSQNGLSYLLATHVADGLVHRKLVTSTVSCAASAKELAERADVILSFGGDGTLLRTAHDLGESGTPILAINIGRVGFLADVSVQSVDLAVTALEAGAYSIDERLVLSVDIDDGEQVGRLWALNDVVIARAGSTGLIALDVMADDTPLSRFWADGLIVSTPTGSTAYSLAVGGPIIAPGSDVVVLSPIAPHSLTVRPIVLPSTTKLQIRVTGGHLPYVLAVDGECGAPRDDTVTFTVRRASHRINLVKLPEGHYFRTLRNKLSWGVGPQSGVEG